MSRYTQKAYSKVLIDFDLVLLSYTWLRPICIVFAWKATMKELKKKLYFQIREYPIWLAVLAITSCQWTGFLGCFTTLQLYQYKLLTIHFPFPTDPYNEEPISKTSYIQSWHVTHLELRSQQSNQFSTQNSLQMKNVDTTWNLE